MKPSDARFRQVDVVLEGREATRDAAEKAAAKQARAKGWSAGDVLMVQVRNSHGLCSLAFDMDFEG